MIFTFKTNTNDGRKVEIELSPREHAPGKADVCILTAKPAEKPKRGAKRKAQGQADQDQPLDLVLRDEKISLASAADRRRVLKALAQASVIIKEGILLTAWTEFEKYQKDAQQPPKPEAQKCTVFMGKIKESRKNFKAFTAATFLEAFKQALEAPPVLDAVIEWDSIEELAILDVDYHDVPEGQRPSPEFLDSLGHALKPVPVAFWHSHGGGLHGLYRRLEIYTAAELAASAALVAKRLDMSCTVEVINRTRNPKSERNK